MTGTVYNFCENIREHQSEHKPKVKTKLAAGLKHHHVRLTCQGGVLRRRQTVVLFSFDVLLACLGCCAGCVAA